MAEITITDDIAACQRVRKIVFVDEQGIALAEDLDGMDDQATHLLATDNGTPIGTARVLEKGSTGKIGRLAVLKPYRGHGIGAAIMRAALDDLAARPHITEARLGAQIDAIAFYEALGFTPEGDEFLDAGLPHQEMVRPL
ncbi:MAG: GNAT family N-acetyltransferase [Boseongicola sp.]|nr:GNAT family N-acetyltransferase [Boseongicola sp.]NNJ66960.1 GNAT family N-acetyltransferase [Boseongicola sp.]